MRLRDLGTGLAIALLAAVPARAADAPVGAPPIPNFWDPARHVERPDTSSIRLIRVLTGDDYPPFDFALPDGTLAGFNVDLARALCEEIKVPCTIQARPWDTLAKAVRDDEGDAVVASLAITAAARQLYDFTSPYYRTPARFVAPRASSLSEAPDTWVGTRVGVVAGTAHAAFLNAYFPRLAVQAFAGPDSARAALAGGAVAAVFGDAVGESVWLYSAAGSCCRFAGGPYEDATFFGEGVGIGVPKGKPALRDALDWALRRIAERGTYAELYLKYFPIGFY